MGRNKLVRDEIQPFQTRCKNKGIRSPHTHHETVGVSEAADADIKAAGVVNDAETADVVVAGAVITPADADER